MEKKEYLQQAGGVLSGVFDVLTIVAKVVLYVLGFALFMFGIVGIAGVISTVFFDEIFFISNDIRGFITPKEFFAMFSVSGELNRFIFSLGSFLLIVFLMIAYTGSKLLFRFKSNSKLFFITGISLLVLASAFTGINSALIFSKYDKEDGFITNEPVAYNSGDTLTLTLSTSFDKAYKTADIDWDKFRIDTENGKLIQIYGIPQLDIIKNEEDSVVLSSEYKIRGLAEGRQAKKLLYQYE
ncbi:MAG: hypothetical protein U9N85_05390, partial [Bacteroidota bacterium]|nr:hypothetical protein [Bacteroidota bacterium]